MSVAHVTRFAVFAKAPHPGRAKTRLIPALGADGAAFLARRMACNQIARAVAAAPGRVDLWCAPDCDDEFFAYCASEFGVALHAQPETDLGGRMHAAIDDTLKRADAAIVIGTDVPGLDPDYLSDAARRLAGPYDIVIGPTEDGGYALIGAKRPRSALFEGIAWSTPTVADATRERMRALGLTWCELPTVWDVDTVDDLARLREWEERVA